MAGAGINPVPFHDSSLLPKHGIDSNWQTNFYEKALFVKPTWRPLCGERDCSLPFALCFYPHFQWVHSSVTLCIMRSVFSS
jgi:hypothetical protein